MQYPARTPTTKVSAPARSRRQLSFLAAAFIAGVLVAVISVQNGQSVTVQFLWFSAQQAPLVVVILLSVLAGFFCGALAVVLRRTKL